MNELLKQYLEKQLKHGEQMLLAEIEKRGLSALDDAQVEYFIPASYKFFEQVRQADHDHNLSILAAILLHETMEKPSEPISISRAAKYLEFLSEFEISVLAASIRHARSHNADTADNADEPNWVNSAVLMTANGSLSDADALHIKTALSVLNARGLLYPDGSARFDKHEEYYFVTDEALKMADRALDKFSL